MRIVTLPLPAFGFIVATRAMLGAGLGLLLGSRLLPQRRRALGIALATIGAATTVPAAWLLMRNSQETTDGVQRDLRLIGATRYPRRGDTPF